METIIFPIGQDKHLIFCILATLLFVLQFLRTKRWYQLVMAIAIPASMLIYVQPENKYIYYAVGVLEAVLLLLALVLNIVQSAKTAKEEKRAKEAADAEQAAAAAADAAKPAAETEE